MAASWLRPLPVRAIRERKSDRLPRSAWPATLPAVRQLLDDGLEPGQLTILVGENGSGKSTIVEGIALAYGLSPEGGSTGARHSTRTSESGLHAALQLTQGVAPPVGLLPAGRGRRTGCSPTWRSTRNRAAATPTSTP